MHGIWLFAFVAQWLLLLLFAVVLVGVLRYLSVTQERMRLAAPPISRFELGESVDAVAVEDLQGRPAMSTGALERGRNVALLFVSASCGSCRTVIAQIAELAGRDGGVAASGWSLALLFSGDRAAVEKVVRSNPALLSDGIAVLVDEQGTSMMRYQIMSVPTGLALDQRGRLLDQTLNPHASWLYTTIGIAPPERPAAEGAIALIVPEYNVYG